LLLLPPPPRGRPVRGSVLQVMAQVQFAEPKAPSAARPGLDPALDPICLKAMAKMPAERFASAKAFGDVLADYLRGAGPGAAPDTAGGRGRGPAPPRYDLDSVAAETGSFTSPAA